MMTIHYNCIKEGRYSEPWLEKCHFFTTLKYLCFLYLKQTKTTPGYSQHLRQVLKGIKMLNFLNNSKS